METEPKAFSPHGTDLFGETIKPQGQGLMAQRFLVPPFSILNAREGEWQDRKRAWLALGIRSEVGRAAPTGGSDMPVADYSSGDRGDGAGKKRPTMETTTVCATEWMKRGPDAGGSIFDPVLCELNYKWYCPPGGRILDPFAGGSVRGIVASLLGFDYWGCDLRPEQVAANQQQGAELCKDKVPQWVCGDSRETMATAPQSDLVFSCPPYFNLEVYSDDKSDLSNMEWDSFTSAYYDIISASCAKLKNNRFAVFVVGELRKPSGAYYNFVGETINAFIKAGLHYYNEAILVTCVGSLPVRAGRQFESGRKLGKTHQNILCFWKGDPKRASETIKRWNPGSDYTDIETGTEEPLKSETTAETQPDTAGFDPKWQNYWSKRI